MLSLLTHRYVAPILAALIYGVWAGWVNAEHGNHIALRVGIIQAVYAFVSTLTVAEAAKWMYRKLSPSLLHLTLTFFATFGVMLGFPLVVHYLAMTPDILEAILPGLLWGSLYILVLLISLDMQARPLVWKRVSRLKKLYRS